MLSQVMIKGTGLKRYSESVRNKKEKELVSLKGSSLKYLLKLRAEKGALV